MTDPRINLKNPWLAGLLAFLLPGAGHLYQGRFFKGAIYLICITGTFLYGMALGEWRPVYWTENSGRLKFGRPSKRNFGFLAQAGMGTPAMIAYMQSRRYHTYNNAPAKLGNVPDRESPETYADLTKDEVTRNLPLTEAMDSVFSGTVKAGIRRKGKDPDDNQPLELGELRILGRIHLEPSNQTFRGTFEGKMVDENGEEQAVSWKLGRDLFVDSRVLGDPHRQVFATIVDGGERFQSIEGTVPRPVSNWFAAPQDDAGLMDLNGRLNKRFEMALVYTWIAGLLNILAIWDAVQGPAYGYGDEKPETESTDKVSATQDKAEKQKSATAEKAADPPDNGSPKPAVSAPVAGEATSKGSNP